MTPYKIEILIHFYVSRANFARDDAPIFNETITELMEDGLIDVNIGGAYCATEKGESHIRQMCQLPFPSQAWVNRDGEVIE